MAMTERPTSYPGTMTAEDYFVATEGDPRTQLVDGVVIVNEPKYRHQRLVGLIFRRLAEWTESPSGSGLASIPTDVVIDDRNVFAPDVWWVEDPARVRLDDLLAGTPDLVVEVRSPSTWRYDTGVKRRRYQEAGASELWLVDTVAESVLVLCRSQPDTGFDQETTVRPGEVLTSPLLPGFVLRVDELFPA